MSTRPVSRKPPQARYLAITPARDEERLLPRLIASLEGQSATPARWIQLARWHPCDRRPGRRAVSVD